MHDIRGHLRASPDMVERSLFAVFFVFHIFCYHAAEVEILLHRHLMGDTLRASEASPQTVEQPIVALPSRAASYASRGLARETPAWRPELQCFTET